MKAIAKLLFVLAAATAASVGYDAGRIQVAPIVALRPAARETRETRRAAADMEAARLVVVQLAARLDAEFALPANVAITLSTCPGSDGTPPAWWNPRDGAIVIRPCDLGFTARSQPGALRFAALHEFAHALITILRLGVTGREEDAADQFATWWLIRHRMAGDALHSADVMFGPRSWLWGDASDTHALPAQRYHNIACWVYGSGAAGADTVRAPRPGCEDEYARLSRAWEGLLWSNHGLAKWAKTSRELWARLNESPSQSGQPGK
jgi:hypothetical protein